MIKKITIYIFVSAFFIPVGMNLWQTCREIGWNYNAGRYSDFMEMKSINRTRTSKVNFLKKHIEPSKSCYFWENPQDNDWLVTECMITDFNYYIYPLSVKYGLPNLKSSAYYIVSGKYDYQDLELYMAFYDLDEQYAKLAENNSLVILKRVDTQHIQNKLTTKHIENTE